MDYQMIVAAVFSIACFVRGIIYYRKSETKKEKIGSILLILGGALFLVGSAMGLNRMRTHTDDSLYIEWGFFIVGFVIFVVGLIVGNKSKDK